MHFHSYPGAYFTSVFSTVIQIQWKTGFDVTPLWGILSQQNFVHATTAQLLCHVQNFTGIISLQLGWEQNEISNKFKLQWKNCSWNGPLHAGSIERRLFTNTGIPNTVCSWYIAFGGVQAMVPRYKWERDISGVRHEPKSGSIFLQRVVSDNGISVCLAANSARRQRKWWHLSKFEVALQNCVVEFPN